MGSEVKVDRELGKSKIHLTPQTPKSSSMFIRLLGNRCTDSSLLTCKTNTVGSDGSLTINLSGGKPYVCPLQSIPGDADLKGLLHSNPSASFWPLPIVLLITACACSYSIVSYIVDLVLLCISCPPPSMAET
jgi:hypothetical protein